MAQDIRKRRIVLVILAVAVLITVNVTIWTIFFRNTAPVLAPDHVPQKTEEYATPVEGEPEEKMQAPQGGGAVSMVYQKSVTIDLNENMAYMMFQNPSKSVNDLVVQLVVISKDGNETVIAQSGKLSPGYGIEQLDLIKGAAELSPGEYTGRYNILYYEPDSGEKSVVNGNIEGVEITVTD